MSIFVKKKVVCLFWTINVLKERQTEKAETQRIIHIWPIKRQNHLNLWPLIFRHTILINFGNTVPAGASNITLRAYPEQFLSIISLYHASDTMPKTWDAGSLQNSILVESEWLCLRPWGKGYDCKRKNLHWAVSAVSHWRRCKQNIIFLCWIWKCSLCFLHRLIKNLTGTLVTWWRMRICARIRLCKE